jgi:hypothetical protein
MKFLIISALLISQSAFAQFTLETPTFTKDDVPPTVELPTCDLYISNKISRGNSRALARKGYIIKDKPVSEETNLLDANAELTRLGVGLRGMSINTVNGRKTYTNTYALTSEIGPLVMDMFNISVSARSDDDLFSDFLSLLPTCQKTAASN